MHRSPEPASVHPLERLVPGPPGWSIDWRGLCEALACLRPLDGCPQAALFHAEGDVAVHTRMVCESLASDPEFRSLEDERRFAVFLATVLHDVGKAKTTVRDGSGRISSPGHSRAGERIARATLWRLAVPPGTRERVASLVRHHQAPLRGLELRDLRRTVLGMSFRLRLAELVLLARADARGRSCRHPGDESRMAENIELFAEYCREQACLEGPRRFASDHARFLYFRERWEDPDLAPHDDTRGTATVMSGLPASGKDTWIRQRAAGLPIVSLDVIREEQGVRPTDRQGSVIAAAREAAQEHLRAGRDFVWNATNVSRPLRHALVGFLARYRPRIRLVSIEAEEADLRNRRRAGRGAPQAVVDRLVDRWSVPDLTESHEVEWVCP